MELTTIPLDHGLIHVGDCREVLRSLPADSVQCCVTSPPYWGLRDYGVEGQLGQEPTPEEFVANLVAVFAEVRRVLRQDGTLWLNLGDSYAGSWGNQGRKEGRGTQRPINGPMLQTFGATTTHAIDCDLGADCSCGAETAQKYPSRSRTGSWVNDHPTLKGKDLIGIPWRVAFALQTAGWYLRADIIWHKPNPMPESVRDRPTKAHEYLFLLAKSERYFYDAGAVRELVQSDRAPSRKAKARGAGRAELRQGGTPYDGTGTHRNRRSVWHVATRPFKGAHFATFPPDLIEPCILAGSRPGDLVLDPFNGAGTTGLVAARLGRRYVGIELKQAYAEMARDRILAATRQRSLFRSVA